MQDTRVHICHITTDVSRVTALIACVSEIKMTMNCRSVVEGKFDATGVRFTRPKNGILCRPAIMAFLAGTHLRCGQNSPVFIMGEHGPGLIRLLVDLISLVLTEYKICVEACCWQTTHRGEKGQFCFRMSPLWGITSEICPVTVPYERIPWSSWCRSENSLWKVMCSPPPLETYAALQDLKFTSYAQLTEEDVDCSEFSQSFVLRYLSLDVTGPNELLLIVSDTAQPSQVNLLIADVEASYTSKILSVGSSTPFVWPYNDLVKFEVLSTFVMRKPQIGHRIFLSKIEVNLPGRKYQVIESIEGRGTVRALFSSLVCQLTKCTETLFAILSCYTTGTWWVEVWDCSDTDAPSKPIKAFDLEGGLGQVPKLEAGAVIYFEPPNHIRVVEVLSGVRILNVDFVLPPSVRKLLVSTMHNF